MTRKPTPRQAEALGALKAHSPDAVSFVQDCLTEAQSLLVREVDADRLRQLQGHAQAYQFLLTLIEQNK